MDALKCEDFFGLMSKLSFPSAIFSLGQELSDKPFSLLSTNPRKIRARWF